VPSPPAGQPCQACKCWSLLACPCQATSPGSHFHRLTSLRLVNMPQLQLPRGSLSSWAANTSMVTMELKRLGGGLNGSSVQDLELNSYPMLRSLVPSGVGLAGELPASAAECEAVLTSQQLEVLDLSSNSLTGTLPSCIRSVLKAVRPVLDLSHNLLSGDVHGHHDDWLVMQLYTPM